MKKIYSFLSVALITALGFAQNNQIETADKLFETYQYVDAIDAYLKLVDNNNADAHVYKQLADSYYHVFNVEEASKWYAKAVETSQDAETYFRYAQTLKSQGKYEEANKQMDVFAKLLPNDQRAITHLENPNYIPQLADKSKLFEVEEINDISSDQSDFAPVLSNNNVLYFVSARDEGGKKDSWTKSPYLDIYKSVRNTDGTLSEPEAENGLNTPYHDGPITLSADGKTMIFARDGHSTKMYKKLKRSKVKLGQQGLFKATLIDGKWSNIEPLPFNSTEYSVTHPSLSSDGKTLYFASNMPGGLGDTDIWRVSVNGNSYGEPENLGSRVNTAGKEGFPFISENHILYFASSGRQGFGGLDIFKVDLSKNDNAINLGNGVNTKSDDFAFSLNSVMQIGYFSSNRTGVDNIYGATPICQFEAIAFVKDATTNQIITQASVSILDKSSNVMATQETAKNGQTSFQVNCKNNYTFNVVKDGFESATVTVDESKGEQIIVEVALMPINEMITETEVKLENIYFEFNKSNITSQGALELDKLVKIMNDYPDMNIQVKSHTDTKGSASYNLKLSERRAQSTMQYLISKGVDKNRLSAKGMGSTEPKIDCKSNCTKEEDALNRRSEFLIIK
ncbi:OmpA family protein [Mangrovimonas spongiae]|uniref:Cell envelope biogenesis protein OmpA n=1 Tax=Mangrovimonas spongiae TaxID=2494697 RepID=A0A428K0L1_9FLAO|nr:OmpA family protein [Mangrovimonas spongiae]RSK39854.1 cell envelope biogenesis protein OmpA [Mangrovimonas spongiae]